MMLTGNVARVVLTLVLTSEFYLCSAIPARHFRGGGGDVVDRTISTDKVEKSLRESLDAMVRGGNAAVAKRLAAIEKSLWQTFQALPKNSFGRLSPRSVRYIMHNYFSKEHGWMINGLEPHGQQNNMTDVHEVSILQAKAPALVEALMEARQSDRGLALGDVVTMAAALERLVFDESVELLESAYKLNDISSHDPVDEEELHEILTSYMLLFEMGLKANTTDSRRHHAIKRKVAAAGGTWGAIVDFEQDTVRNFDYASRHQTNPFVQRHYNFETASHIVENLAEEYGKWQHTECRQMKEELMDLSPDSTGRVPLRAFYSQPSTADYQFTESLDYLREIGALDEPANGSPQVRIANYMTGPSNCIASSTFYSVCCLSECEGLLNELEGKIQAPAASPERLESLVSSMASSSVDAPRQLPEALVGKLQTIAERHHGEVPLHGRLFSQWLHYAFPNECPYPQVTENTAALTPGHWQGKKASAPVEERRQHIEAAPATEPEVDHMSHWSDHEILVLHEPQKQSRSAFGSFVRTVMQMAMFCVVLRIGFAGWQAASGEASGKGKHSAKDKGLGFMLPMHSDRMAKCA